MMGLDYVTKSAKIVGLTEEEYLDIYAKSDKPDTTYYNAKADGKSIVHYTIDFKDSRRKKLEQGNAGVCDRGLCHLCVDLSLGNTRNIPVRSIPYHPNGDQFDRNIGKVCNRRI